MKAARQDERRNIEDAMSNEKKSKSFVGKGLREGIMEQV